MNHVSFDSPEVCPSCGSHNWKITGTIFNEDISLTQITLQCLRYRTSIRASHVHTENDQIVTNLNPNL